MQELGHLEKSTIRHSRSNYSKVIFMHINVQGNLKRLL
jgi:hypothetical protein